MSKCLCLALSLWLANAALAAGKPFEILVLDDETNRGVPLVELKTTSEARYITDSAGRIAFDEPDLFGQEVYFHIQSHGYEAAPDGFGFRGMRFTPRPGERAEVKITRKNIAERLCRLTGQGIYRDSALLGYKVPQRTAAGTVTGQDSVQAIPYDGRLFWFWGDTNHARYPLGLFRTAGATSPLFDKPFDPANNIDLAYFTDQEGRARAMIPLANEPDAKEGVVWIDGLAAMKDDDGRERLVCHFMRLKALDKPIEQGLAVWNDKQQIFERAATLPLDDQRHLSGHPLAHREGGTDYLYCGVMYPTLRVPATLSAVLDPGSYEAWSCLSPRGEVLRDEAGRLDFAWRKTADAWTPSLEQKLRRAGHLKADECVHHPRDSAGKPIHLAGGSVRYNAYRQKFIAIGVEQGGTSFLGEIWYSEAPAPQGPWKKAVKIVTHDKYSFYNPVQHAFLDADGGRTIYFEGTYTHTFSGNNVPTPRYDYNQVLYRLNLDDPRLKEARE